jgi:Rap1a immunity proteins
MRISALLLAAGLLSPVSAYSQETAMFHSGNQLYKDCITQERSIQSDFCIGYLEGAVDAFSSDGTLCLPPNVAAGQVQDMVMSYLRAHPENRHYTASSIVRQVLEVSFSCKKQPH